jgi:hypothetical protein
MNILGVRNIWIKSDLKKFSNRVYYINFEKRDLRFWNLRKHIILGEKLQNCKCGWQGFSGMERILGLVSEDRDLCFPLLI